MQEVLDADENARYVDRDQEKRGSKGPFFVVYADANRTSRWGYYCDNCETLNNAMDSMGRIQCNVCSNVRKPEEWDAVNG